MRYAVLVGAMILCEACVSDRELDDLSLGSDAPSADLNRIGRDLTSVDAFLPSVEICNNGVDDDNDGLIDCADSDCTIGWECVPDVASDQEVGIVQLNCAEPYPDGAPLHQTIATPTCTGCTCTGVTLCKYDVMAFSDSGCQTPLGGTFFPQLYLRDDGPLCVATLDVDSVHGIELKLSTDAPLPSWDASGVATRAPLSWSTNTSFCHALKGGGCDAGSVCQPRLNANANHCMRQPGTDQTCPNNYPNIEGSYYGGATDTRVCKVCADTCATTSIGTCPVQVDGVLHFTESVCDASDEPSVNYDGNTLTTVSQCVPFSPTIIGSNAYWTPVAHSWGTTAVVQNTIASGTATPSDPWTVCCR